MYPRCITSAFRSIFLQSSFTTLTFVISLIFRFSSRNLIDSGFRAIIFEGTGLGHIGENMYPIVKMANEKGIFMGMTSQCIDGRVRMTVYESGRDLLDLGIIPLENMIPEIALVKAMWVSGNTEKFDEIKDNMLKEIASEFST